MPMPKPRGHPAGSLTVEVSRRVSGGGGQTKHVSIRLVEQNFALFSKELVDLVLDESGSCAYQLMVRSRVKATPTDTPNMTSQVQEFFT